jgi:hypothetical protein
MANTAESKPPVKLWDHVCTVFEAMKRYAHAENLGGRHALVYTGHTTQLFRELQMATPYYTSTLRTLKTMGCVKQLSRGGGSAASRWELIEDPVLEAFESVCAQQKQDKNSSLEGRVLSMEQRMTRIEETLELGETGS